MGGAVLRSVGGISAVAALAALATLVILVRTSGAAEQYERPFGPRAPWNIPVSKLQRHPNPELYVPKLWKDAPAERPGNFNLSFETYTYPVYSARDATEIVSMKLKPEGS